MNVVLYYADISEYTDGVILCAGHTDGHTSVVWLLAAGSVFVPW